MNVNYHLNLSPSSLEIIYRSVDGLRPDPANPRCHSKKQVRQIAESIKAFGFNVPILIDREGNVIAGHARLATCRDLGMTQVPTLCLDHLTPAQMLAFRIADNRLTEIATWDDRLLAEQLKDLSLLGSISASRSPVLRWPRSICGSCPLKTHRKTTIPPMDCPGLRRVRRSASSEIFGGLVTIVCYAAVHSIPRPSQR